MTTSNLTQRQLKWAKKLTEYDFKVTYWEGKCQGLGSESYMSISLSIY